MLHPGCEQPGIEPRSQKGRHDRLINPRGARAGKTPGRKSSVSRSFLPCSRPHLAGLTAFGVLQVVIFFLQIIATGYIG